MSKWYIIHTLSGSEKKVKQQILDQISKRNMTEYFEDIVVPVVEVPDIKRGKAVKTEKKYMPGYILIKMIMNDASWHLVMGIKKISGFLGDKSKPQALSTAEAEKIFKQVESETKGASFAKLYEIGEQVVIIDGPFDTFSGLVEDVNYDKKRIKVSVSIFGKATPIELAFSQVKKN